MINNLTMTEPLARPSESSHNTLQTQAADKHVLFGKLAMHGAICTEPQHETSDLADVSVNRQPSAQLLDTAAIRQSLPIKHT